MSSIVNIEYDIQYDTVIRTILLHRNEYDFSLVKILIL